jgi:hypothetical protein
MDAAAAVRATSAADDSAGTSRKPLSVPKAAWDAAAIQGVSGGWSV